MKFYKLIIIYALLGFGSFYLTTFCLSTFWPKQKEYEVGYTDGYQKGKNETVRSLYKAILENKVYCQNLEVLTDNNVIRDCWFIGSSPDSMVAIGGHNNTLYGGYLLNTLCDKCKGGQPVYCHECKNNINEGDYIVLPPTTDTSRGFRINIIDQE